MKKIIALSFALYSITLFGQQNFTTGMNAAFTIPVSDAVSSAISSKGMIAIPDQFTSISIWYQIPIIGTEPADVVIAADPLSGIAWSQDGNKLIVSEEGLLKIWNSIPTVNNQAPDITTNFGFGGVIVAPDGRLIVSDINADYIYIWNSIPTTNNQAPDLTYGGRGTANNLFFSPLGMGIAPDGKFLVAEEQNSRVLVFDSIPVSTLDTATLVIGQTDFASSSSGTSNSQLDVPLGVTVTVDGKVIVSDLGNNRVLIWNSMPTVNGAAANIVLGQQNFTSNGSGSTMNQMDQPFHTSTDISGRLFVSGRNMDRTMVFGEIPEDTVDLAITSSSTPKLICNSGDSEFSFDFTLKNNGPDTAKNITVIAALPYDFSISNYTISNGTYSQESGYWQIAELLNGDSITLQVSMTANTVISIDTLYFTASIQQVDAVDITLTNNQVAVSIFLNPGLRPTPPTVTDETICIGESTTLTAVSSDTVKWYNSSTSTTPLTVGLSYTTPNLTDSTTYYVEANNRCTSLRVETTVNVEICNAVSDDILSKIKVYPNPSTEILSIEIDQNIDINTISISNVVGELISFDKSNFNNSILTIDISSFENGVYFITLEGKKTFKVIKK